MNNFLLNDNLAELAKTIYDYWFVQFDFPDENGKPYKSSGGKMVYNEVLKREIPEGWEVKKLGEILDIVTGRQDANFATINGNYKFFTCGDKVLNCDTYEFEGKAILLAGNGNFNVKMYNGKFNAYQRVYVLIPKNEIFYSVLYLLIQKEIEKLTKSSNGSIIKFITKGDVANIQIIDAKNDNLYNKLNNLFEKVTINNQQIQHLQFLRDWLLPMLMNGQISVE